MEDTHTSNKYIVIRNNEDFERCETWKSERKTQLADVEMGLWHILRKKSLWRTGNFDLKPDKYLGINEVKAQRKSSWKWMQENQEL